MHIASNTTIALFNICIIWKLYGQLLLDIEQIYFIRCVFKKYGKKCLKKRRKIHWLFFDWNQISWPAETNLMFHWAIIEHIERLLLVSMNLFISNAKLLIKIPFFFSSFKWIEKSFCLDMTSFMKCSVQCGLKKCIHLMH